MRHRRKHGRGEADDQKHLCMISTKLKVYGQAGRFPQPAFKGLLAFLINPAILKTGKQLIALSS
jgi:hypothetical protein